MLLRRSNFNCGEDSAPTHGHSVVDCDLHYAARDSYANRYASAIRDAQPHRHPGHALSHAHQHSHSHATAQRDTHAHTQRDPCTQRNAAPTQRHTRTEPHQLTRKPRDR